MNYIPLYNSFNARCLFVLCFRCVFSFVGWGIEILFIVLIFRFTSNFNYVLSSPFIAYIFFRPFIFTVFYVGFTLKILLCYLWIWPKKRFSCLICVQFYAHYFGHCLKLKLLVLCAKPTQNTSFVCDCNKQISRLYWCQSLRHSVWLNLIRAMKKRKWKRRREGEREWPQAHNEKYFL